MDSQQGYTNIMQSDRDDELRDDILFEQRVSIQTVAYTIYLEVTPNNKKPLTPRVFRDKYIDN